MKCPICDIGELNEEFHETNEIVGLVHSICDYCGEWIVTPEQSRHNKKLITNQLVFSEIPDTP